MPCLRLLHSIPCEYICSTRGFQSQFLYRAKHPLFGVETLCSLLNEMYAWVILPLGIIQEPLRERFDVNDVAYYLVDCIKLPFVIEWHYVSVGRRGRHHPHMAIVHGEPSLVVERVDHIWNIPPDDQDVHVALEVTVDESIHCWLPHPRLDPKLSHTRSKRRTRTKLPSSSDSSLRMCFLVYFATERLYQHLPSPRRESRSPQDQ
mmetsp:Transcript_7770/g.28659  ORF Transcript_7770/g.28659 Transcript_7770/m.28659 type:complete len:205 (+) Transcript_7770:2275-2889(+)